MRAIANSTYRNFMRKYKLKLTKVVNEQRKYKTMKEMSTELYNYETNNNIDDGLYYDSMTGGNFISNIIYKENKFNPNKMQTKSPFIKKFIKKQTAKLIKLLDFLKNYHTTLQTEFGMIKDTTNNKGKAIVIENYNNHARQYKISYNNFFKLYERYKHLLNKTNDKKIKQFIKLN